MAERPASAEMPQGAGHPASVARAEFAELGPGPGPEAPADIQLLAEVPLTVTVELGRALMRVRDLLALREGSVIELDRAPGSSVDVMVNGKLVARGDVVVVEDEFGVRVTEVVDPGGGS
ncbi:MAG TPA: flagellar motor switch protein FliN [Actinomycetota bacterium]|nr:flagellar motor switch protein FliN [Actinomycetota bacterium]